MVVLVALLALVLVGGSSQAQPQGPDLTITDFWAAEQGQVCYQIQNVGQDIAPKGHTTALTVDGQPVSMDLISQEMAVGERLNRCFANYGWQCSGIEDTMQVCAD